MLMLRLVFLTGLQDFQDFQAGGDAWGGRWFWSVERGRSGGGAARGIIRDAVAATAFENQESGKS